MEIHGMTAQEINHKSEEDHNDDKDIDSEEEIPFDGLKGQKISIRSQN